MSSDIAISVTGLSKCFQIYERPHHRLAQMLFRGRKRYFREFWALKDVSFEVRKGETVGIIGRNGSGKSTLLQMICETLSPSGGSIKTQGRIAALLELGSGFNPEFTGHENIYLNCAVLGLTKAEVDEKYEEIVRFADIGDFIWQPVRTYSSGMYVRLAFAVQACIDPEILIVDEALAVGDIGFQYKCFRRMELLRAKGVTILMVTHSTSSILEYADRCLVLSGGRLVGNTTDVLAAVMAYEKGMILAEEGASAETGISINEESVEAPSHARLRAIQREEVNVSLGEKRFGSGRAVIASLIIHKSDGVPFNKEPVLRSGDTLTLSFDVLACDNIEEVVLGVSLSRVQGGDIWGDSNIAAGHPLTLRPGKQRVVYQVTLPVNGGDYLLHCGLACLKDGREELDQRRPMQVLKFWSSRELGGVVHAPITVLPTSS